MNAGINRCPPGMAVALIAGDTARELSRQRGMMLLLGVATLAVAGGGYWREFNFGANEARFLVDFGRAVQVLVATLLAVVGTAQVVMTAFGQGTAAVALARPTSAATWVAGKALGVWSVVAGYLLASTLGLVVVVRGADGESIGREEWAVALGLMLGKQAIVVAFTVWFACYGRSVVFVGVAALLLTGLGQLRGLIGDDGGLVWWGSRLIPHLGLFDEATWREQGGMGATQALGLAVYAAINVGVFGGLATWALKRREL